MSKNSFADKMNDSKLMLAGIKQNAERLAKRGLDSEFVTNFETAYNDTQTLDNEQEKLKAEVATKTQQVNQKLQEVGAFHSEAKKIVKIEMENSTWKEFGINAKR